MPLAETARPAAGDRPAPPGRQVPRTENPSDVRKLGRQPPAPPQRQGASREGPRGIGQVFWKRRAAASMGRSSRRRNPSFVRRAFTSAPFTPRALSHERPLAAVRSASFAAGANFVPGAFARTSLVAASISRKLADETTDLPIFAPLSTRVCGVSSSGVAAAYRMRANAFSGPSSNAVLMGQLLRPPHRRRRDSRDLNGCRWAAPLHRNRFLGFDHRCRCLFAGHSGRSFCVNIAIFARCEKGFMVVRRAQAPGAGDPGAWSWRPRRLELETQAPGAGDPGASWQAKNFLNDICTTVYISLHA